MPDSAPVEPQQPAEQYPSQISCTEAFDRLTDCYSIGGLVRHYYRHGEFNGCSKEIERFKFCILHGSDPVRVQQWYREEWEMNKSTKGTSEDVWKQRKSLGKRSARGSKYCRDVLVDGSAVVERLEGRTMSATPDTGSCLIANHLSWTVDEVIEWAFGELQLTGGAKMAETAGPEAAGGCEKDGVTGAQPEGLGGLTEAGGAGTAPTLDSCRRNFRQHKITGDVLPFLTLDDCKQLFDGDARLGVKFKIAINGLKRFESGTTAINKELVATLNNLHNTIADKLQEYQSQYARLRVDILEVMKRSITPSSGIAPGAHTHHSTQMQDYFERPQQHGHSGHPSPISPRNHPAAPAAQRRTSSNNPPGIGVAGPPPPVVPSNAGIATSGNNSSGQVSTTASPNEPLKQLRASKEDSTEKILKNAMKKHNLNEADWRQYVLVICYGDKERILEMDEQPVVIFKSLKQQGLHPAIMLRQKGDFEEVGDLTPGGRL